MRKILLVACALLSLNTFAMQPLGSTIIGVMQSTASMRDLPAHFVYGGQDISRPRVAVAHETLWTGQHTLIG